MRKPRKNYTSQEKLAILHENLVGKTPVSELCDKRNLKPTVFYRWQQSLFENGDLALQRANAHTPEKDLERTIAALEAKLAHKDSVIAQIMEDHVALKKNLGNSEGRVVSP